MGILNNPSDISNVRRRHLAEKIINLFKPNAYPFGGYLRDLVAGVPFTDLDMYFPINNRGYDFMSDYIVADKLKGAGLTIIDLGETEVYANELFCGKIKARKFEVIDQFAGTTIRFDMVTNVDSSSVNDDHPFVIGLDADVNCLWRDKYGNLAVAPNVGKNFTVDSIKKNIAEKVFTPMGGEMRECRAAKLAAKGYRAIGSPVSKVSKKSEKTEKVEKKESKVMEKEEGLTFAEQFKKDAENAAYQSVGTQVAKAAKEGLLAAMKAHGADDGAIAGLTKLLDTPAGEAAISSILGHGLPHAPMIGEDERVQRLAEQMRVNGYAVVMNFIFGMVMQYMLPGIQQALEKLPAVTKTTTKNKARIGVGNLADEEAEAEEEAVDTGKKSAKA